MCHARIDPIPSRVRHHCQVYLYREGFARFTSSRFSLGKEELANSYIHLTNHAVQKRDENYNPETTDLKWPLRSLRLHLMTKHGAEAAARCFHAMLMVIVNALRAVQPVMINDKHCCELYGYDILLDDALKPWLARARSLACRLRPIWCCPPLDLNRPKLALTCPCRPLPRSASPKTSRWR